MLLFPGTPASTTTLAWMSNSSTSPWLSFPPLWQISSWGGTFQGQQTVSELGKPKGWSVEYGGEGTVGSHEGVSDVLGTPCLADTYLLVVNLWITSNRRCSYSLGPHRNLRGPLQVQRPAAWPQEHLSPNQDMAFSWPGGVKERKTSSCWIMSLPQLSPPLGNFVGLCSPQENSTTFLSCL